MMTKAEIGVMCLNAKDGRQRLEVRNSQGSIIPWSLQRKHDPMGTLLSDPWHPEVKDKKFCCIKPPSLEIYYNSPKKQI